MHSEGHRAEGEDREEKLRDLLQMGNHHTTHTSRPPQPSSRNSIAVLVYVSNIDNNLCSLKSWLQTPPWHSLPLLFVLSGGGGGNWSYISPSLPLASASRCLCPRVTEPLRKPLNTSPMATPEVTLARPPALGSQRLWPPEVRAHTSLLRRANRFSAPAKPQAAESVTPQPSFSKSPPGFKAGKVAPMGLPKPRRKEPIAPGGVRSLV